MIIFHSILFLILSFFIFYCIGNGLLLENKKDLMNYEIISVSLALGLMYFLIIAILLGVFHIRFLMLPILTLSTLASLWLGKKEIIIPSVLFLKDQWLSFIIILSLGLFGSINFFSGWQYSNGILFWSSQGFDGFWHVALMTAIQQNFPPQNPIFAGVPLSNYHYLVDVIMGEFGRIFPMFSNLDLYFRFFPVLFITLLVLSIFSFVQSWKNSRLVSYWAIFFTLFTGSFGYIIVFLNTGKIFGGETAFWVAQLNTLVGNPPHMLAFIMLLNSLVCLIHYQTTHRKIWLLYAGFVGMMVAGFKVSGGIVYLAGIFTYMLYNIILGRQWVVVAFSLTLLATNYTTILLITQGAESYLIFSPWWFVRTMVVVKLNLIDWERKRQYYLAQGTWRAYLRILQLELIAFGLFFIGNLGMRIIGLWTLFHGFSFKKAWQDPIFLMITAMLLTSFTIPMLFLQKGIAYNSVQFFQYFLLFFGIMAAFPLADFLRSKIHVSLKIIATILIVVLAVPTVIGNLAEFYGPDATPLAIVTNQELEALHFLQQHSHTGQIVLTPVYDPYLKDSFLVQPKPIYSWYSTAYITGLTGLTSYLACEDMADQLGLPDKERRKVVEDFFNQKDVNANSQFLRDNAISFVYIPKIQLRGFNAERQGLRKIFENAEIVIFQTNS
jgi:hypothetical protein